MHCTFFVLFAIGLLHSVYCNNNLWWNQLLAKSSAHNLNQWSTTSGNPINDPSVVAASTVRSVRRSGQILSANNEDSAVPKHQNNNKSWDKNYSRTTRHSYKRTWGENTPVRESYIQTQWDDDVPVSGTLRDNASRDKEKAANTRVEKKQYERPIRQSLKDVRNDNEEVIRPEKQQSARNTNSNKPTRRAHTVSWNSQNVQPKSTTVTAKSERVTVKPERLTTRVTTNPNKKNTFEKRMESWDKLARDTFGDDSTKDDYADTDSPNLADEWDDVTTIATTLRPEARSAKLKDEVTKKPLKQASSTYGWRSAVNHGTSASARQKSTTNSYTDATTTFRPRESSTSTVTFERAKLQKPLTNSIKEDINKKKQHRIGTWISNDERYRENTREEEYEGFTDTISSQPIREDNEEFVEQLPERVASPQQRSTPQRTTVQKSAPQRRKSESADYDNPTNWRLEDSIPGTPGEDYGIYATIPKTAFNCRDQELPGYYADTETLCQVFHICQSGGRSNSFLCPNGTMFNQQLFVCDWWHNVDCPGSTGRYALNANIYDYSFGKRTDTNQGRGVRRTGTIDEIEGTQSPSSTSTAKEPDTNDSRDTNDTNNNDDSDDSSDSDSDDEDSAASSTIKLGEENARLYVDERPMNDDSTTLKYTRFSSPIARYKSSRQSAQYGDRRGFGTRYTQ